MEDFIKKILSGELDKVPSLFTFLPFSALLYVDLWFKLTSDKSLITGFQSLTTLETIVIFSFFCATATFVIEPMKVFGSLTNFVVLNKIAIIEDGKSTIL